MKWLGVLFLAGVFAFGCSQGSTDGESTAASSAGEERATEERAEEARVDFNLEEATLHDLARVFVGLDFHVTIQGGLSSVAGCVCVSVSNPNRVTVDEAITMTARALAAEGVVLRRTDSSLALSAEEGRVFPPCDAPQPYETMLPPPREVTSVDSLMAQIRAGIGPGPGGRLVTRAAYDSLLENSHRLFEAISVVPHEDGGRVESVRMYGLQPGGLLGALGFRNGDGIRRVNGGDMTDPNTALETYVRMRSADEVHVELERDDEGVSLRYTIVDSLPTP